MSTWCALTSALLYPLLSVVLLSVCPSVCGLLSSLSPHTGSCLIISGFMKTSLAAFVFMNVALGFFGFVTSGLSCAFLEVSPNFSSTINTVANMVGAIAGFVGKVIMLHCHSVPVLFLLMWGGCSLVGPNYEYKCNCCCYCFTISGPLVVSLFLLLFESSELAWRMVFFLTAGFAVVSLIHWNIYQTSEVVPALNNPSKTK